jgi:hypothetical protein
VLSKDDWLKIKRMSTIRRWIWHFLFISSWIDEN